MEINRLSTQLNAQIDGSSSTDQSRAASKVSNTDTPKDAAASVSLSSNGVAKSDEQFAKIELEKANQASFSKLKDYKARINEFQAAKDVSDDAAAQTELGKMLNDPAVWQKMAENMLR